MQCNMMNPVDVQISEEEAQKKRKIGKTRSHMAMGVQVARENGMKTCLVF